jgi:hypothetical protein
MTAGQLITEMRKLLNTFNEENDVYVERIDVECAENARKNLQGIIRDPIYDFHFTFKK